jgi:Fur family ferric uptake transcriptional regulator
MPSVTEPDIMGALEQLEGRLARLGYRRTRARHSILRAILEQSGAFTIRDLTACLEHSSCAHVSSLFRTLKLLSEINLIQRIHSPTGCDHFCLQEGAPYLIVCQGCSIVTPVPLSDLAHTTIAISRATGHQITHMIATFVGVCPSCQAIRATAGDSPDCGLA